MTGHFTGDIISKWDETSSPKCRNRHAGKSDNAVDHVEKLGCYYDVLADAAAKQAVKQSGLADVRSNIAAALGII